MYPLSSPRATVPSTAVSFALGAVSALAVVALSSLLWTLHTPREFAVALPAAHASTDSGPLRAPPATVPNELDEPPEELPPTF